MAGTFPPVVLYRRAVIFFSFLVCVPPLSFSYQLDDHSRITHQAIKEFNYCFDEKIDLYHELTIEQGNRSEDLDLLNKWIFYSHYYHPEKELQSHRYESDVRVSFLEDEVKAGVYKPHNYWTHNRLGHMVHHLQDVTSPPHVVPVSHALNDGFESYPISDREFYKATNPFFNKCSFFDGLVPLTPLELLDLTARHTLNIVKTPITELTWEAFWKESDDDSFGSYGFLGNNFGEPLINVDGVQYTFLNQTYKDFNLSQFRSALDVTKRVLFWLHVQEERTSNQSQQF